MHGRCDTRRRGPHQGLDRGHAGRVLAYRPAVGVSRAVVLDVIRCAVGVEEVPVCVGALGPWIRIGHGRNGFVTGLAVGG